MEILPNLEKRHCMLWRSYPKKLFFILNHHWNILKRLELNFRSLRRCDHIDWIFRRFFLFPRLCCSQTPWVNGWYDIQHFQMEKLQLLKTTKCFTIGSIFEKVSMSSKHRLGVSFIHYRSYTKQSDVTYQFLVECLSL